MTRFVKARARVHGSHGWHLRDSEGVIESVHTLRLDGFCDGLGFPDWEFWHEATAAVVSRRIEGRERPIERRPEAHAAVVAEGGIVCFEWYPRDGLEIEHTFRYGLGGVAA